MIKFLFLDEKPGYGTVKSTYQKVAYHSNQSLILVFVRLRIGKAPE